MPHRMSIQDLQRALCRIVRNPTVEVIVAIALVILAVWLIVETDIEHRSRAFPVPIHFW